MNVFDLYEEEMRREYNRHEIPHLRLEGDFTISWYPVVMDHGKKTERVEYGLQVSGQNSHATGTFEAWKRGKGLL